MTTKTPPHLSNELLAMIFDELWHIDRSTLASARLCSRVFEALIAPFFFRSVKVVSRIDQVGKNSIEFRKHSLFKKHAKHIQNITVKKRPISVKWPQGPDDLITDGKIDHVIYMIQSAKRLKTFTWTLWTLIPPTIVDELHRRWPKCRLFCENFGTWSQDAYNLDHLVGSPCLSSIKTTCGNPVHHPALRTLLSTCPNLKILEIDQPSSGGCAICFDMSMRVVVPTSLPEPVDKLSTLTRLVLVNLTAITSPRRTLFFGHQTDFFNQAHMWADATEWTQLRSLKLGSNASEDLVFFLTAFNGQVPGLRDLSIQGKHFHLDGAYLKAFVAEIEDLESLQILELPAVDVYNGLKDVTGHLHSLRHLYITGGAPQSRKPVKSSRMMGNTQLQRLLYGLCALRHLTLNVDRTDGLWPWDYLATISHSTNLQTLAISSLDFPGVFPAAADEEECRNSTLPKTMFSLINERREQHSLQSLTVVWGDWNLNTLRRRDAGYTAVTAAGGAVYTSNPKLGIHTERRHPLSLLDPTSTYPDYST